MTRLTNQLIVMLSLVSAFLISASNAYAEHRYVTGDEDTILIEWQPTKKVPYNRIIRHLSTQLFNFDTRNVMSFGEGKRNSVARNFGDYWDRSKTRFNVSSDSVELKFRVNL